MYIGMHASTRAGIRAIIIYLCMVWVFVCVYICFRCIYLTPRQAKSRCACLSHRNVHCTSHNRGANVRWQETILPSVASVWLASQCILQLRRLLRLSSQTLACVSTLRGHQDPSHEETEVTLAVDPCRYQERWPEH